MNFAPLVIHYRYCSRDKFYLVSACHETMSQASFTGGVKGRRREKSGRTGLAERERQGHISDKTYESNSDSLIHNSISGKRGWTWMILQRGHIGNIGKRNLTYLSSRVTKSNRSRLALITGG
jgi:hypothetical protein